MNKLQDTIQVDERLHFTRSHYKKKIEKILKWSVTSSLWATEEKKVVSDGIVGKRLFNLVD